MSFVEVTDGDAPVVALINWQDAKKRRGQRVELDERERLIFSMVVRHPWKDYPGTIIHPDVGVAQRRVKGKERQPCPKDVLRLKRVWQKGMDTAAANASGLTTSVSLDTCLVCDGTSLDNLSECAFCLNSFHDTCCQDLLGILKHNADALPREEPRRFTFIDGATRCPLCDFVLNK